MLFTIVDHILLESVRNIKSFFLENCNFLENPKEIYSVHDSSILVILPLAGYYPKLICV